MYKVTPMNVMLAWLSALFISPICVGYEVQRTKAVSEVLDHLLDGYRKEVRPGIGGERVVIDTDILIKSMGPIKETDMSYSMQVYFRQRWKDDRLSFYLPNITSFTLSNKFINNIWKPNSYFINGRRSKQHNLTVPNAFIRLRYDGSIYMSVRLTVNARCPMVLSRYPMDRVVCPLYIGSFGYTTRDLVYRWENQVDIDPGVTLSQFELGRIEQQNITRKGRYGDLSILQVYIHMSRAVGFFIIQTYVPCYLIVCLSWVSFWINRDGAQARVVLGVTTILTTSAIGITVREGLPRVPYPTALDVFLIMCIVYQMAAFIEYAAVNYFTKLMPLEGGADDDDDEADNLIKPGSKRKLVSVDEEKPEQESQTLIHSYARRLEEKYAQKWAAKIQNCSDFLYTFLQCIVGSADYRQQRTELADPEAGNSVSAIDMVSRVVFPVTFGLVNLCYWLIYFHLDMS
ncbi:gamma-aminobutyric acid receptor subunit alpha-2-like [Biomphalaria glabrata]|uniref:Gamma-aminobutyric acid receptor subunit alpha-2-like n=1 Tax=Biomphalaria glabrata TaxID=6526 RepID=A0A9W3B8H1_BIOGL|nr:gamma-aminobutyric acid receptor subunit alpha-2-like [Biomphalaria glabrata]XP_055895736.1 gamma-aminobutyric acid receptor subunit alpha-2-like [Biomphalaria glabrata]